MGVANWIMHLWYHTTEVSGTKENCCKISNVDGVSGFQMPLNYPRFKKPDYVKMDEERLKLLLAEYGLRFEGGLDELREYAIRTFLWPDQL